MATHVKTGDSVECSQSMVAVRRISNNPVYLKMKCLNGETLMLHKYKSSIRAIVKITEELNPLKCVICDTSKLILGDMLEGDVLAIYTKKRVKMELTSNFSHVHGIQGNNVNNFTYAKIDIPWPFVLNRQLELPKAV